MIEQLIVFDYLSRDEILEGLLYQAGIHTQFEPGLIICRVETENQRALSVSVARGLGRQDYLSVDLNTNFSYWHFISCVKVKFVGYWKYEENHADGERKFLLAV